MAAMVDEMKEIGCLLAYRITGPGKNIITSCLEAKIRSQML